MHTGELSSQNKGTLLSDLILGGQDGLVNVLGVILGVAAASQNMKIIIAIAYNQNSNFGTFAHQINKVL